MSTDKSTVDTAGNKHDDAMKLLTEKGLTFGEKLKIRKCFMLWAQEFDKDIQFVPNGKGHDKDFYKSKLEQLNRYSYYKEEEVKVVNALHKLAPLASEEKLVEVLSLITKLLDVDSEYKFKSTK